MVYNVGITEDELKQLDSHWMTGHRLKMDKGQRLMGKVWYGNPNSEFGRLNMNLL